MMARAMSLFGGRAAFFPEMDTEFFPLLSGCAARKAFIITALFRYIASPVANFKHTRGTQLRHPP
jgi:hypothetical protein